MGYLTLVVCLKMEIAKFSPGQTWR